MRWWHLLPKKKRWTKERHHKTHATTNVHAQIHLFLYTGGVVFCATLSVVVTCVKACIPSSFSFFQPPHTVLSAKYAKPCPFFMFPPICDLAPHFFFLAKLLVSNTLPSLLVLDSPRFRSNATSRTLDPTLRRQGTIRPKLRSVSLSFPLVFS